MELPRSRAVIIAAAVLVFALPSAAQVSSRPETLSVSAGPDLTLADSVSSVVLEGRIDTPRVVAIATDFSIQWTQLGGVPVQILEADTLRPTVVVTEKGSARLQLRVEHPLMGSATDVVRLTIPERRDPIPSGHLTGELRKWHKLSLTFKHSSVLAEGDTPNPFLDLVLNVRFQHIESGVEYVVPGFFAADGEAADTGASTGDRYRVHFTPDRAGEWFYEVDFRAGNQVAVLDDPSAGRPASFNGRRGFFFVQSVDPYAPGFLSKGRLEYVAKHHLRFAETGEFFLKNGADSPENFLAYYEFDNTVDQGGAANDLNSAGAMDGLHHFDAHLADYSDLGVELWMNGKGARIFGAINYLASRGVNSIYNLTYNIDGGDGREVWPWWAVNTKQRFDVSKLAQWERVVDHMSRAGIVWHVITQETENDRVLDGGTLGVQRKLYYRELIARFGHAPGLVWNLGEENSNTPAARKDFFDYIRAVDPYDHPIAMHNRVGDIFNAYGPLLGTHLELASLQGDPNVTPAEARQLIADSAAAGRPWVVNFDEQNPAMDGVVPDAVDFWHDEIRRKALWPILLGQGGGCEWYFGYSHPHSDLDCEDFRSRDNLWLLASRAVKFVRRQAAFADMQHADALASASSPSVLADPGHTYLIYLPFGGPLTLDLRGQPGLYDVHWYDARNGGVLQTGAVSQVVGDAQVSLGAPPGSGDWVALVNTDEPPPPEILGASFGPSAYTPGVDFTLSVRVGGLMGSANAATVHMWLRNPDNVTVVNQRLEYRGGELYSLYLPQAPTLPPGSWQIVLVATGIDGQRSMETLRFEVE